MACLQTDKLSSVRAVPPVRVRSAVAAGLMLLSFAFILGTPAGMAMSPATAPFAANRDSAYRAYLAGDLERSAGLYKRALSQSAGVDAILVSLCRVDLARVLFLAGKTEDAASQLAPSLSYCRDWYRHNAGGKGRSFDFDLERMEKLKQAIDAKKAKLPLTVTQPRTLEIPAERYYSQAGHALAQGDIAGAIELYKRCLSELPPLQNQPGLPALASIRIITLKRHCLSRLADLYERSHNDRLSLQALENLETLENTFLWSEHPTRFSTWRALGIQYFQADQPEKAIPLLELYLKAQSHPDEDVLLILTTALLRAGKLAQAQSQLNKLAQTASSPASTDKSLARQHLQAKIFLASQDLKAKPILEKLLQSYKPAKDAADTRPILLVELAQAAIQSHDLQAAERYLSQAESQTPLTDRSGPSVAASSSALAMGWHAKGRDDKCVARLKDLLTRSDGVYSRNPELRAIRETAWFQLGLVYLSHRQLKEARYCGDSLADEASAGSQAVAGALLGVAATEPALADLPHYKQEVKDLAARLPTLKGTHLAGAAALLSINIAAKCAAAGANDECQTMLQAASRLPLTGYLQNEKAKLETQSSLAQMNTCFQTRQFARCIAICQQIKQSHMQLTAKERLLVQQTLCLCYQGMNKTELLRAAVREFDLELQRAKNTDKPTLAQHTHMCGFLYYALGDTAKAQEKLLQSAAQFRQLGPAQDFGQAESTYWLADSYFSAGQHAQAVTLYRKAYELYKLSKVKNEALRVRYLFGLGRGLARLGQSDEALLWLAQAHEIMVQPSVATTIDPLLKKAIPEEILRGKSAGTAASRAASGSRAP